MSKFSIVKANEINKGCVRMSDNNQYVNKASQPFYGETYYQNISIPPPPPPPQFSNIGQWGCNQQLPQMFHKAQHSFKVPFCPTSNLQHVVDSPRFPNLASPLPSTHINVTRNPLARAEAMASGRICQSSVRGVPSIWTGELPPPTYRNAIFSCKLFVGGVPWDTTELALIEALRKYGTCRVEMPTKQPNLSYASAKSTRSNARSNRRSKPSGYVYIIFDNESSVKRLMADCCDEFSSVGDWYFKLKTQRNQTNEIRQVQVIPWSISDCEYAPQVGIKMDPKKTVFVGALHGMLTAQGLYVIMSELYGNVVYVSLDTDKHKYPIGSGRVMFSSQLSYYRAVESAFIEIKTTKFSKRIQIDPFLEEVKCSQCDSAQGPYFCRERSCFKYYCLQCWQVRHSACGPYGSHKALLRKSHRSIPVGRSIGDNRDYRDVYFPLKRTSKPSSSSSQLHNSALCMPPNTSSRIYASSQPLRREAILPSKQVISIDRKRFDSTFTNGLSSDSGISHEESINNSDSLTQTHAASGMSPGCNSDDGEADDQPHSSLSSGHIDSVFSISADATNRI